MCSLVTSISLYACESWTLTAELQRRIQAMEMRCYRKILHIQLVFIDFKKAFDRVWHAALWATMKKYNISANLIRVIKSLYDKATSAILFNSSIGN